jgi:hypothetical protein
MLRVLVGKRILCRRTRAGFVRIDPHMFIGQTLDTIGREKAKPLKYMALPSGIEPLSPP